MSSELIVEIKILDMRRGKIPNIRLGLASIMHSRIMS